MYITQIYSYIKSIIDQSDGYNLDVLYYFIRKTILEYEFSLEGVHHVDISDKYLTEPTRIKFIYDYSSPKTCIALLMSLRAIRINPSILDSCNNDYLFFKPMDDNPYGWLKYCSVIINNEADPDFFNLFCIMEDFEYDGYISDSHLEQFREHTIQPPCRNQENYYRKIAKNNIENTKDVIIDNAFLNDSTIIEYVIPEEVEYIGHTAFSYCHNLKKITFSRRNTIFGKFSIIECPLLKCILVPKESEDYYKEQLAFYKDIIFSSEQLQIVEKEHQEYSPQVEEQSTIREPQPITRVQESYTLDADEQLPVNNDVTSNIDYKKIEQIFKHKSTTYKYFWFMSILDLVKERGVLSINNSEIIAKMIALSWPYAQQKISFGPLDNIPNIIQSLILANCVQLHNNERIVEDRLIRSFDSPKVHKILSSLSMNVPYRFLSPWIKYTTGKEVMSISQSTSCATPYALYKDYIILDESWFDYFVDKYDELYTMTKRELINYLKKFNEDLKLLKFMID